MPILPGPREIGGTMRDPSMTLESLLGGLLAVQD